jgi:membrane protein
MIKRIIRFLDEDIWRIRTRDMPKGKVLGIKSLRVLLAARRGFDEHRCPLRASALTFFSLLSIVPVVAMAFGIAKGFHFEKMLQQRLLSEFVGQEEVLLKVFEFADKMLETTKGGLIAGIGVIVLFWTFIKLLGNIESSFNDIWGVKKARPLPRMAADYLSLMLIAPVLFVLSSSATVFVATQISFLADKLEIVGALKPVLLFILKVVPFAIMWFLFGFIYIFIPNTRVGLPSGIVAGIFAGTCYQIVQWVYIRFQVGVASYNAIYGSFAALPLFLAWLQLSWLIVLAGAEIAQAHQHADLYEYGPDAGQISPAFRKLLSLWVTHLLCRQFAAAPPHLTANDIARITEIPGKLLAGILDGLEACGIITAATPADGPASYQPALDTNLLTVKYVLDALEGRGVDTIPVARSKDLDALAQSIRTFGDIIASSPANLRLRDI